MKIIKPFKLIAILSMLAAIFSCQTVTTESITVEVPTVETAQDEALSKSVRDRLLANNKADFDSVKIVSSAGTVYLSGTVRSLEARQQAIKIAWDVRGVQSVVNRLEVEK
jgi:osmotically-inducible protein OsmY